MPDFSELCHLSGINLFIVGSIDEIGMMFKAGFLLQANWFDYRLTYINLKDKDNFIKGASKNDVWLPLLLFPTCSEDLFIEASPLSTLVISKKGNIFCHGAIAQSI